MRIGSSMKAAALEAFDSVSKVVENIDLGVHPSIRCGPEPRGLVRTSKASGNGRELDAVVGRLVQRAHVRVRAAAIADHHGRPGVAAAGEVGVGQLRCQPLHHAVQQHQCDHAGNYGRRLGKNLIYLHPQE